MDVRGIADIIRQELGESPTVMAAEAKEETFTTASLDAVREYSIAQDLATFGQAGPKHGSAAIGGATEASGSVPAATSVPAASVPAGAAVPSGSAGVTASSTSCARPWSGSAASISW